MDDAALQRLCEVARMAGREIMRYYGTAPACRHKADGSPVSIADLAAERVIVEALAAWNASIPIITEESSMPSAPLGATCGRYWVVDPLDGTKEFLARNGEFTVNVALVDEGTPVLGVILAPAFVVESRSHPSRELEAFLASIPVIQRVPLGSSLKFCRVAEGSADLYPRFGPMMEWDVAAGDCIYRNSADVGERASPLRYDTPDRRVAGFVLGDDAMAATLASTPV
jgi:3'(2'), 5'-bisphosphate nucleotidase